MELSKAGPQRRESNADELAIPRCRSFYTFSKRFRVCSVLRYILLDICTV